MGTRARALLVATLTGLYVAGAPVRAAEWTFNNGLPEVPRSA